MNTTPDGAQPPGAEPEVDFMRLCETDFSCMCGPSCKMVTRIGKSFRIARSSLSGKLWIPYVFCDGMTKILFSL